jgi:hypothetical protein
MSLEHSPDRQARTRLAASGALSSHPHPHLTRAELAERWRVDAQCITRNWRKLGLRPIKVVGKLLFPLDQIEAVERRRMHGEEEE